MKNINILVDGKAVKNYVDNLWSSDFFKKVSKDKESVIYKLTSYLMRYPLAFFEYSDEENERSHFTAWFRFIAKREYDNKVIQDLYYYHELFHAATLVECVEERLNKGKLAENWGDLIVSNEFYASLESEVFIYFRYPELRELTFNQEIWYDQLKEEFKDKLDVIKNELGCDLIYLRHQHHDDNFHACWGPYPAFCHSYVDFITEKRRFLMQDDAKHEDIYRREAFREFTFSENQIKEYSKNNRKWAEIWKNNALLVETMLYLMKFSSVNKFDKAGILSQFIGTILQDEGNGSYVPFLKEAKAFAEIYNNRGFKNK